ncbi:helix-turn-helix domain-containing protein [Streptomyces sp. NPDC055722]
MSEGATNQLAPAGRNVRRNVRRLREQHGYSYVELSERLAREGRSISTLGLSALERGERCVDIDDLVALAAVFDLGPEQLLQPPEDCGNCHGAPPLGFICMECDTTGLPARRRAGLGPTPEPAG